MSSLLLELQILLVPVEIVLQLNMPITRKISVYIFLNIQILGYTFANSVEQHEQQIKFEIRKLRHLDIYLSGEIPFRYD